MVLNKFNVLENHALLITDTFVSQLLPLGRTDFEAAAWPLALDGWLVFFNGGKEAGASEPHRHLQVVPIDGSHVPIQVLLEPPVPDTGTARGRLHQQPGLGFRHRFAWLPLERSGDFAGELDRLYREAMAQLQLYGPTEEADTHAYNLLMTRDWFLLVPRVAEMVNGLSFNAMAFGGYLLVRSEEQLAWVKEVGLAHILQALAGPPE